MNTAFRDRGVRLSNCIITNVPGPQEPLYFMGARLELFTGLGPITPNSGITIPVTSYRGELCIAPTGCPGWVTDPQLLAECLDESYRELSVAAAKTHVATGKAPKARPARRADGSGPAGKTRDSAAAREARDGRPDRNARSDTSALKSSVNRPTRRTRARRPAATRRR
jgi:hypothetical protein